jgi:hypothetical protein
MKWNREEVSRLLNAKVTDEPLAGGGHVATVQFEDTRMQYELWIHEADVWIAADPERPIRALPFFEISVACTELAPVPRSGMPTGIGFYSGPVSSATLCFSITRRDDGSVSLSGAWKGWAAARRDATRPSNEPVA